jgi:hypothetical protein
MDDMTTTQIPLWQEYTHTAGPDGRWDRVPAVWDAPDTDPVRSVVPDSMTATASGRKVTRSNTGRTAVTITRHGRPVLSAGSTAGTIGRDGTRGQDLPASWLEDIRTDRDGRWDAVAITRLADRWAAMVGEDIPADLPQLVGGECISWEQVVRADYEVTAGWLPVWVNPAGPVEAAVMAGYLDPAELDTAGRYRDTAPAIGSHELTARDVRAELLTALLSTRPGGTSRPVTRWPSRLRLPVGRARRGDVAEFTDTAGTVHLVAPGPDMNHRWVGHKYVTRPDTAQRTDRAARRTARVARSVMVDGRPDTDGLGATITQLANGMAVRHRWTDTAGTRWEVSISRAVTGTDIPGTWTLTIHRTIAAGSRVRVYGRGRIRTASHLVGAMNRVINQ